MNIEMDFLSHKTPRFFTVFKFFLDVLAHRFATLTLVCGYKNVQCKANCRSNIAMKPPICSLLMFLFFFFSFLLLNLD